MGSLEDYFPYANYRSNQRQMLEFAAACARDGKIAMIDAPTGSGKSSVVAALLSEAQNKKIIIGVRTVSQLTTFIRELDLIRKRRGNLRFAYLIGKSTICPMAGEGDVYRKCEALKALSSSLMRERAMKGSLVPIKDPVIRQQIKRVSHDHPIICPYFIYTRIFLDNEDGGLKVVPSSLMSSKGEKLSREVVWPTSLHEFCNELCPYETMLYAARMADVVILNFHHLFDEVIREQIYLSLGIEAGNTLLLIDEAHNCGEAIQNAQSVSLDENTLELAASDLTRIRKRSKTSDAIKSIVPEIRSFIETLKRSYESEDWFDPLILTRYILRSSLYPSMQEVVDDLLTISEGVREANMKAGDFRISGVERLATFLYRVYQSSTDAAFLTIYRQENGIIVLEVRSIDPGNRLSELAQSHSCCLLISGTLTPVESFRRYFFGDIPIATLTLQNTFPIKNRCIICTKDITTTFRMRQEPKNVALIQEYIKKFDRVKGNVAIFFPSYQLMEAFATENHLKNPKHRLFIEPRDASSANSSLCEYLALPSRHESGLLLAVCGGKWSEGLDYRGEMLSGAMVIGLPLAPFNRVREMIIRYFKNKFGEEGEFICYTLPAINRTLQALGRVLRSPEDKGILVFGEKRFLEPRIYNALPAWIQNELVIADIRTFEKVLEPWC